MSRRHILKIYALETRRTFILAVPIIAGHFSHYLLNLIDSMMVGRVGTVPLAASSLANSLFAVFMVFGLGVGNCVSIFVSRSNGAQDSEGCASALRHGLILNIISGILLVAAVELLIPWMSHMNQPPEVVAEAQGFLRLLGLSLFPMLIFQAFKNFSEGLGETRWPMVFLVGSVVMNSVLNYFLIFGKGGFPALGLWGAGLATLLTRSLICVVMIWFSLRHVPFEPYLPKTWFGSISWPKLIEMLRLGIPTGLQVLFEVGIFSAAAVMMGWMGAIPLAAHQIVLSFVSLTFMFPLGLSFAVSIRIGNAVGAQDLKAIRRIGLGALLLATVFGLVFMMMCFGLRNLIPSLFVKDIDVIQAASTLFLVAGAFQIFDGLQVVCAGSLRGLMDVLYPTLATFGSYWIVGLPLGYALAFPGDLKGVGIWIGLALGLATAAIALGIRFLVLSGRSHSESRQSPQPQPL